MSNRHQPEDSSWTAAYVAGALDGAAGLSYLAGIDVAYWHSATLLAKLLLIIYRRSAERGRLTSSAVSMVVSVLLLALVSLGSGNTSAIVAAIGFTLHLCATLLLVTPGAIKLYCSGVASSIGATTLLHLVLLNTSYVPEFWGRYMYFNGNHPNLGGEIEAIGAIAAVISQRRRVGLAVILICMIDSFFLQSRAALITETCACGIWALFPDAEHSTLRRLLVGAWFALFVMSLLVLFGVVTLDGVRSVMLYDDDYRGIGTGLVGRTELWASAYSSFLAHPIQGNGLGYVSPLGDAHNIIVTGLAQGGLLSLPFFLSLLVSMAKAAKTSRFYFCIVMSVLPLLVFNDRFVNINPYPMVYYCIVLVIAQGTC
jgi:hypothetical protein